MIGRKTIFVCAMFLASSTVTALTSDKAMPATCKEPCHVSTDYVSLYTQGPTVTTSPYLGIRSAFDAHDLIVNLPTMNEDLRLLRQRQHLKHILGTEPCANRPLVEISGDVVGQASYFQGFNCDSTHDINLVGARFDAFSEASEWASAYISIDYDNSPLPSAIPGAGSRIQNSRIFLKRGFLTIGELDACPVYFSIGQMFAPFGRYAAATLTAPLTLSIGQTNVRAALLGYFQDGFYAQAYGFKGDTHVGDTGINQWGLNAGYEYTIDVVHGEFGAGYIANIADATGIQSPLTSQGFRGFAFKPSTEQLEQRVPAYDFHGTACYGPVSLIAEYINTTRPFAKEDLSFNGRGARLSALHLELHAQTNVCDKPVGGSIAYGFSCDALGLGLPAHSLFAVASTSIWKNTIESVEYRYDCNYCRGDVAGGGEVASGRYQSHGHDDIHPGMITSTGGSRSTVVGSVGVYF